jgi:ribosome-associated protein
VLFAVRAQGAGGQHVNKVSSAIHLRFDVHASSLPEAIKHRLLQQADRRLNDAGVLIIKAQQHRSQALNRSEALERLAERIRLALRVPAVRHATRPTRASQRRRVEEKISRGRIKALRRSPAE